jgi:hypothetical protein
MSAYSPFFRRLRDQIRLKLSPSSLRIPGQVGHRFRFEVGRCFRFEAGHLFRRKPATDSDLKSATLWGDGRSISG